MDVDTASESTILLSFKVTDYGQIGLFAQNRVELVKWLLQEPALMDLAHSLWTESWAAILMDVGSVLWQGLFSNLSFWKVMDLGQIGLHARSLVEMAK